MEKFFKRYGVGTLITIGVLWVLVSYGKSKPQTPVVGRFAQVF